MSHLTTTSPNSPSFLFSLEYDPKSTTALSDQNSSPWITKKQIWQHALFLVHEQGLSRALTTVQTGKYESGSMLSSFRGWGHFLLLLPMQIRAPNLSLMRVFLNRKWHNEQSHYLSRWSKWQMVQNKHVLYFPVTDHIRLAHYYHFFLALSTNCCWEDWEQ